MSIPAPPASTGFTWAPATLDDAAGLAELFNGVAVADQTPERFSTETLEHRLNSAHQPLERRTIVARTSSGAFAAYGTVYYRADEGGDHRAYVSTYVSPTYRDGDLEDALTDWVVSAAIVELGESKADRRYVCAALFKKLEDVSRRFSERGFEPVRHWWEMERPLAEDIVDLSESGLAKSPWNIIPWADEYAADLRLVHNAAFVDHWGNIPMSVESWQKLLLDNPAFRPDLSFVALSDAGLVGYAYNEMHPEDWEAAGRSECWISALGVAREWRKKGIASALLTRSMLAMRDDGVDAAMIGVDSASPTGAQHLYRSVGFRTKTTATTWQLEVG